MAGDAGETQSSRARKLFSRRRRTAQKPSHGNNNGQAGTADPRSSQSQTSTSSSSGNAATVPTSQPQSALKTDLEKGEQKAARKLDVIEQTLPYPIRHFLGYRRDPSELHPKHQNVKPYPAIIRPLHKIPLALESLVFMFLGAFVGIAIAELVFARPAHFTSSIDVPPHEWAAPILVGSFGASSVLLYAAHASPLGQPRCFVGGQTLSAVAGVSMTKLIKLAGPYYYNLEDTDNSQSLVWVAGALATGVALMVMSATGTLHPPGGATAVLCATNVEVERLGWRIIPVVLLTAVLMLTWTLIWMNLGRKRYPENWFAPSPPAAAGGNISQLIIDWGRNKWHQRQLAKAEAARKEAAGTVGLAAAPDAADAGAAPKDAWEDQGPWIPEKAGAGASGTPAGGAVSSQATTGAGVSGAPADAVTADNTVSRGT